MKSKTESLLHRYWEWKHRTGMLIRRIFFRLLVPLTHAEKDLKEIIINRRSLRLKKKATAEIISTVYHECKSNNILEFIVDRFTSAVCTDPTLWKSSSQFFGDGLLVKWRQLRIYKLPSFDCSDGSTHYRQSHLLRLMYWSSWRNIKWWQPAADDENHWTGCYRQRVRPGIETWQVSWYKGLGRSSQTLIHQHRGVDDTLSAKWWRHCVSTDEDLQQQQHVSYYYCYFCYYCSLVRNESSHR